MTTAKTTQFVFWGFLVGALLVLIEPAWAGQTAVMPWDPPLTKIKNFLIGPVVLVISVLGVVMASVSLAFGSEFSDFTRKLLMLVLGIAFVMVVLSSMALGGLTSHS